MFSIKDTTLTLALIGTLTAPLALHAGNVEPGIGHALMSMDGTAPKDVSITAVTGWHICDVIRTGAGWGNHFVALTCPSGPFTNKWHILKDNQKDAMLATALSAATSGNKVQVHIAAAASGYNVIGAIYLHK